MSMARLLTLALCLGGLVPAAWPADGKFGSALNVNEKCFVVAPNPAFARPPLTVECWVRLESKQHYNIIIANETKRSPTHWELFTTPRDGFLHAYLPGRKPDHVRTQTDIVDGRWRYVAMGMEPSRVRLYVDGRQAACADVSPAPEKGVPGALSVGALAEGTLRCSGWIDEVRLSRGVREIKDAPPHPFVSDENTLGLWHFDGNDSAQGEFKKHPPAALQTKRKIPGGMPTEFQPLPPAEDVAPLREALRDIAIRLGLKTIDVDGLRDGVLREWSYDFQWHGRREYPESRGGGPDAPTLNRQVYDRHALLWESDGGPAGTVLRRTAALMDKLADSANRGDLDRLKAACESSKPPPDSPQHKAYYLAACALRRQTALANPLLDFDTILFVARGTFEGSVRSNPRTADYQGGHFVTQYFGFNALPGGGLYLIRNFKTRPEIVNVLRDSVVHNGRFKGRKLDYGAFATPDLSWDARTIVFAWTENREHKWVYSRKTSFHIFKVNVDGSDLTQLTDGDCNDFDPCWLPDGRIAFISERRGGYIRCFAAYLKVRNYTLFSMKDDGSDIVPLSYYETSEWNPSVNNEGQIVYTRWDYTDRENCLGTRFWVCGPDGSDPRAPHGNYPLPYHTFEDHTPWKVVNGREIDSRIGAPLVEMGIRAIPNSNKHIFTAAPHHGQVYGTLCLLDLNTSDDRHMSQVRRITPDEAFAESEMSGRRHYKYGTPWPLSEDFYLCNVWENMALADRYGNKEMLCELRLLPCAQDERLRVIDPIPVRPRPRPLLVTPKTRRPEPATIALMNVYDSDLPFPPDVKRLRIVQNILKTNHAMGEPMIGYERENTPRIPLGTVPVEQDGSAYFEAPVAKELIFQALDENHMAVQSMRSCAFVHPGEQLACLGCHEGPQKAPSVTRQPMALKRAPSKIEPEIGPVEPISYYRQIKPIFDAKCVKCHAEQKKGPADMSYEKLKEGYSFWFSGAMWQNMCSSYSGVHGGSRSIPGRFGARNSKIGQALMNETHRRAVAPEDRRKIIVWLDCNSLRLGSYIREDAQLKGGLVWPTLDVDPRNVLGVEGMRPALRRNFWHENTCGPYNVLISEHQGDRVAILNEKGDIVWDYAVPHPQDVWMLPNGNVLTTYYQGVREVTRSKKIVWEYKTQKPNEIPACQPLPDGNVLIGIVGECRLIEVNPKGEVVHEVKLSTTEKTPHAQFRMCRKTPEGTYLVPFMAEGAVREYDRDGRVIREFPRMPSPVCALRLENGNTLITADRSVVEYAKDNRVVWELTEDDIPDIAVGVLAGVQLLENGNLIVCNWNARDTGDKDGAHIFEVTHDKRVTWQITGSRIGQVAQCQLLNADLMPRAETIWR